MWLEPTQNLLMEEFLNLITLFWNNLDDILYVYEESDNLRAIYKKWNSNNF